MPISSFYGLQTSLRGLLAQQRLLDTTGHNIANASTQGYSRQEAVARRLAGARRSRPAASSSGGRRPPRLGRRRPGLPPRPRPVPRPPVPRPEHEPRRVDGARRRRWTRPSSRSPSRARTASTRSCSKFWDAWSDARQRARATRRAKQALVEQGAALADAFASVRVADRAAQTDAAPSTPTSRGPRAPAPRRRGRADRDRARRPQRRRSSSFVTAGDTPNDLLDRRDQLLDQLSEYGQVSVDASSDGTINVCFVDGVAGTTTRS